MQNLQKDVRVCLHHLDGTTHDVSVKYSAVSDQGLIKRNGRYFVYRSWGYENTNTLMVMNYHEVMQPYQL